MRKIKRAVAAGRYDRAQWLSIRRASRELQYKKTVALHITISDTLTLFDFLGG